MDVLLEHLQDSCGSFNDFTDDIASDQAKVLVFCSGKFYYDLIDARADKNRMDVAIVRLEQLFPLPEEEIQAQLKYYKNFFFFYL